MPRIAERDSRPGQQWRDNHRIGGYQECAMIHHSRHRVTDTGPITGQGVPLPTLTHTRTCSKDGSLRKERRVLHNSNDAKHTHQQPTRAVGSRRNRKAQRGHHNLHSTQPAVHRRLHPGAQRAHAHFLYRQCWRGLPEDIRMRGSYMYFNYAYTLGTIESSNLRCDVGPECGRKVGTGVSP